MARTVVGSATIVRQRYYWPDAQLNLWTIIMLAAAGTILGVNAQFMMIQSQMRLGVPWIMPYSIAVGTITIIFILIMLLLIAQRRLLPGVMAIFSFILLVLFITGIVGTALQLFAGPNVNNLCNQYVGGNKLVGPNASTLAWLMQQSICQSWQAVFAFWIIGTMFLVWMMVMASQVNQNQYDYR